MEPVRFGVIGCGLMGREFASVSMRWLHLAADLPRPVIVAACDLSDANLGWFRQVPDTKYFYHDYQELLQNPEVEAVYCAVPHHLHAKVYGDVIRAGKHLLGEKPFGMDLAACGEMLAAEIASLHNIAFYLRLVTMAREHIAAGDFTPWKQQMVARLQRRL